jgi:hypothetical protein
MATKIDEYRTMAAECDQRAKQAITKAARQRTETLLKRGVSLATTLSRPTLASRPQPKAFVDVHQLRTAG